ncbi:MAG: hypothetical protein HYS43_01450 [Candidatus Liptonbacteria bacterium]|nr:hypothetical protein [Candidatus Liptonbacteria bacterium]
MNDIIKKLGLETATAEEKQKVLTQLTESLLKRLMARIYQHLTDEQKGELERLVAAGDEKRLNDFLLLHIPNLDHVREEELNNLVAELESFRDLAGTR